MTDSFLPRYVQIEQALRRRIADMRSGDALPSDAELCDEFNVSRMTARQAVQLLVHEGLVRRSAGRGTFVAAAPSHRQVTNLVTFSAEMRRQGRVPSSKVVFAGKQPAKAEQARALGVGRGSRLVVLHRLRLADSKPIAWEATVLRRECERVLVANLERGSLHRALCDIGFVPTEGRANIRAEGASKDDAELLGVAVGDALLVESRIITDQHGDPLEFTVSRYAGDRYQLDAEFSVEQERMTPA